MASFSGWDSTASRLQSHYKEAVYFLPISSRIFLVLIWPKLEGWKVEWTLKPTSDFERDTPELKSSAYTYDWAIDIY